MADPQLAHRQALAEVHDRGGSFRALNPPFRFSATAAAAQPFVAALGEHSAAVLTDLGYGRREIDELVAGGIVGMAPVAPLAGQLSQALGTKE